jgi:DNA repair protein RecO (recombination protein O)
VSCHQPLTAVTNFFSVSAGGVLCPACQVSPLFTHALSVNALKVLRFLQDNDWSNASRLHINQELAHEVEQITRNYLRYLLEREVKSVAWLDTLREQTRNLSQEILP